MTEQEITKAEKRKIWKANRAILETDNYKRKRSGKRSKSRWSLFVKVLSLFEFFLKIFGLYKIGYKNAKNIEIKKVTLNYSNLPKEFDGYKLLHLTDLHIDSIPGLEKIIIEKIKGLKYDLCVMTGDYRKSTFGSFKNILKPIYRLTQYINAPDGTFAVLGNHDTYLMSNYEERINIELLVNESAEIKRGGGKIILTGTDDPFRYFTDQAIIALEESKKGFKIALVHTTELSDVAAESGYNLYLCGHTHGGQICLPGGKPLITHQFEGKGYYKGLWNHNGMKGYTSKGCGVSGLNVRFNCPGEITVFTLKKN